MESKEGAIIEKPRVFRMLRVSGRLGSRRLRGLRMRETQLAICRPTFNRSVRIHASSDQLIAGGRALLLCELLHRAGWVAFLSVRVDAPGLPPG